MSKETDSVELQEYRDRKSFKCIHGHNGLTHLNCYRIARGKIDRIGIFDIETFELNADWGFAFSYCFKKLDGKIIRNVLSGKEVLNPKIRDKRLIKECCEDMKQFDSLVVFYGKDTGGRYQRHDIPFMRTRALKWGIDTFPKAGEKTIIDIYDCVKAKMKMKSNSLKHACQLLGIPCKLSPHDWGIWQRARDGNERALGYILKHNAEDVVAEESLFKIIYPYKRVRTPI